MQICGPRHGVAWPTIGQSFFFLRTGQNKMTNDIDIVTKLTIRLSNSLIDYILEFLIEAN